MIIDMVLLSRQGLRLLPVVRLTEQRNPASAEGLAH